MGLTAEQIQGLKDDWAKITDKVAYGLKVYEPLYHIDATKQLFSFMRNSTEPTLATIPGAKIQSWKIMAAIGAVISDMPMCDKPKSSGGWQALEISKGEHGKIKDWQALYPVFVDIVLKEWADVISEPEVWRTFLICLKDKMIP